jgi:teichoic acid transport system permease protein
MSTSLVVGARSLLRKRGIIRGLEFPRAIIPISSTLTQLILIVPALIVMLVLVLLTGESIQFKWIIIPIIIAEMFFFSLGIVFVCARLTTNTPDIGNLIPVFTQLARYVSGVFYLAKAFLGSAGIIGLVIDYQPFSLYLQLARGCLMREFGLSFNALLLGGFYAVFFLVLGLIFFWQKEAEYGKK